MLPQSIAGALPVKETHAASESPCEVLKRTLSARGAVATPSSSPFPVREKAESEISPLRVIGLGSCGSVFEVPGTDIAYKKGSDAKAIWNDVRLTIAVHNALCDTRSILQKAFPDRSLPRTPLCHEFHRSDSKTWWDRNGSLFPDEHRTPGAVFSVEKILPLPQQAREALIALYFDEDPNSQREAIESEDNTHCLVRVYLGDNESPEDQESYDSLRNFPLKLNMMKELDMEVEDLAMEMAIGLAVIHWQAMTNGMDAEFVLGSAATRWHGACCYREPMRGFAVDSTPHEVHRSNIKTIRSTHLWILDFDKAAPIALTKGDVDRQLVPAFLGNDPYFPRPDVDRELWEVFSRAYLKASRVVLEAKGENGSSVLTLPQRFLDKVVEMIASTAGWDPEEDIVFQ